MDQAIFTHRVFVNLYIAGSSAAPNSGPSTKMVSSCVMTSWKKKTFEEQFVHLLPNSNAHKKCCSAHFSHNSCKTVLPASAHYKLHFHSIPSFINVCKMLRNNFKADRTIFRQLFSLKNTELPELSYICLYCDRAGCTSLHIFGDSSCHGGHVFCGYLCWWWSGYNPSHTNAVLALHWNPCQRRASSWQTLAVRGCNKQVEHVGPTSWTTRQSDVRIQFLEATHLESELNPYTVVHSQRLKGTCEQELSCVSAEHVPRYSNYLYDQQLEPYCWWFKPSQNQVVVEGWILDHQQHGDRM